MKTGSTALALYNLSASATRDNLSLIAVIMKAPTPKVRFSEAEKLLDYGFSNYNYKGFANNGDVLKSLYVQKGVTSNVNVLYQSHFGTLLKKGEAQNIEEIINMPDTICAPIYKGQYLGEVSYVLNGETIGKVDLIAENDVKKVGIYTFMEKLFWCWLRVLR